MPKASLTLENGTVVTIEGSAPEIHELLAFYASAEPAAASSQLHKAAAPLTLQKPASDPEGEKQDEVDLMAIV
jgi:hypothetical protein